MTVLDFSTTIGNAWFASPVFTASGCASSGRELAQFFPLHEIGAVVTKSVMNKPRAGRATPRMAETASGMLNSIGLQGPGIDSFIAHDIPYLLEQKARIIIYGQVAACAVAADADALRRDGQLFGVVRHPAQGKGSVVERGRKAVFGRQTVVHSHHADPRHVGDLAAKPVVAFQIADHPAAAMEEHQARRQVIGLAQRLWRVDARWY